MIANRFNPLGVKYKQYDAEVEFLESTGTQWIDTGIVMRSTYGFSIKYSVTVKDVKQDVRILFGSNTEKINTRCFFGYNANYSPAPGCMMIVGWGPIVLKANPSVVAKEGKWYTAIVNNPIGFAVDGLGRGANLGALPTQDKTARLFNGNMSDARNYNSYSRIASCVVFDNGVPILDLIPVRKGTIGYMYDRVSGQLFGNSGTGEFVLGADK